MKTFTGKCCQPFCNIPVTPEYREQLVGDIMCGRLVLETPVREVAQSFRALCQEDGDPPRYNIAPTQPVVMVHQQQGVRVLARGLWGLALSWMRVPGPGLINLRVETVAEKPSFQGLMRRQRCLIPVNGFYEWHKETRQPFHFRRADGTPFALAGFWSPGLPDQGTPGQTGLPSQASTPTLTIMTAPAGEEGAAIHARMPVMVPGAYRETWLDVGQEPVRDVQAFAQVRFHERLEAYPVARTLNKTSRDGPALLTPCAPERVTRQLGLF